MASRPDKPHHSCIRYKERAITRTDFANCKFIMRVAGHPPWPEVLDVSQLSTSVEDLLRESARESNVSRNGTQKLNDVCYVVWACVSGRRSS